MLDGLLDIIIAIIRGVLFWMWCWVVGRPPALQQVGLNFVHLVSIPPPCYLETCSRQ